MSETLFRFLLSELITARVVCMKCGGIAEFPADQLDTYFGSAVCHFCKQALQMPTNNGLAMLGKAIRTLKQTEQAVEVRFDIKQEK